MKKFEATTHVISENLDANPDFYKIKIVNNVQETLDNLKKGSKISMSVNMENYNVYIGSDHLNMQVGNSIPSNNLCAGYVRFDTEKKTAVVEDLSDWRKGMDSASLVKGAIEQAFNRDIKKLIF